MDKIQKVLIKAGRKDLAEEYFRKVNTIQKTADASKSEVEKEFTKKVLVKPKKVTFSEDNSTGVSEFIRFSVEMTNGDKINADSFISTAPYGGPASLANIKIVSKESGSKNIILKGKVADQGLYAIAEAYWKFKGVK